MLSNGNGNAENLRHWLIEARGGSREALGQLLEACRPFLLQLASEELAPDLRPKVGASDLVQNTFLSAQQCFDQFQGSTEAEWLGWLRRILLNHLGQAGQKYRHALKRDVGREVPLIPAHSSGHQQREPILDTPSPGAKLVAREEAARLYEALERLPEEYRQVLLLRHRDELSFAAIGQAMNRSEEAARKLWGRANKYLDEVLGPAEDRS